MNKTRWGGVFFKKKKKKNIACQFDFTMIYVSVEVLMFCYEVLFSFQFLASYDSL